MDRTRADPSHPSSTRGCPVAFDPLAPAQLEDPYPVYARLRREAPVHFEPELDLFVVSRDEDVRRVVEDPDLFLSAAALVSRPGELPEEVQAELERGYPEAGTLTFADGEAHDQLRRLAVLALEHEPEHEQAERVSGIASRLVDEFASGGRAELVEAFAWPFPLQVIAEILGLDQEDLPYLHRWSVDWLRLLQDTDPPERQASYARGTAALQRYVLEGLRARARWPRDDVMTELVRARSRSQPPLSMIELMRVCLSLIVPGHVIVTRALGSALLEIVRRPEVGAALRDDPDATVEELLRLEPPAQGVFRTAAREAEVGGVTIPAGAKVMVLWASANRDAERFSEPDRFDPARADLAQHLAWGYGVHRCVGERLAQLELRVALPLLLERLPELELDPAHPPERETLFFGRGLRRLWLRWQR